MPCTIGKKKGKEVNEFSIILDVRVDTKIKHLS